MVFAAHDGRVAHLPANIGHGGLDFAEDRPPARCGNRRHQDLTGLDFGEFIGVHDHPGDAFNLARRSGHAFELAGVAVVTGQPLVDLFGGDAPQHAGKRFGDGLRWGVQRGCWASGFERFDDLATSFDFFWPLHPPVGASAPTPWYITTSKSTSRISLRFRYSISSAVSHRPRPASMVPSSRTLRQNTPMVQCSM